MKRLAELDTKKSIELVNATEKKIFVRDGVWNPYEETNKESAIRVIKHGGYGATVDEDDEGNLYIKVPCSSDMW